jgi:hypothetical protein
MMVLRYEFQQLLEPPADRLRLQLRRPTDPSLIKAGAALFSRLAVRATKRMADGDKGRPKKQQNTSKRIFERLCMSRASRAVCQS